MKIVLVGASGYAESYLRAMDELVGCWDELCAVVDPFVSASAYYARFIRENIPVYDTLEAFFAEHSADLAIISSPIQFHKEQAVLALSHGAHVLCEKPLAASAGQAMELLAAQRASGKQCGVGFQLSFSPIMRRIKRNILDGAYGKPLILKTTASWPRDDGYYASAGWKGRIRDGSGRLVRDSIATNAAAHYLHNMFFVLGETMDTARMPKWVEGSLYRARPIESFDTCFIRGEFEGGVPFYYGVTHVSDGTVQPMFAYEFEKATIWMRDSEITAVWNDGRREAFGTPRGDREDAQKLISMREVVAEGRLPECRIETVLPHQRVCDALFERFSVHDFSEELITRVQNPPSVEVKGLLEAGNRCFAEGRLPNEMGFGWAAAPTRVDFE